MDLQCQAQALALTWELIIMADECHSLLPQRTKKLALSWVDPYDETLASTSNVTPGGHGQVGVGLGRTGGEKGKRQEA